MKSEKLKTSNILVISLTNIGDVILTFPVLDILKRDFPECQLSVVVGPRAEPLFRGNPHISKVYVFDKKKNGFQKLVWLIQLRRIKFDLVVDLRNTIIPFMLDTKHCTPPQIFSFQSVHMKKKYLNRLKSVIDFQSESKARYALFRWEQDIRYIDILVRGKIGVGKKIVVVAPGAANHIKRWTVAGFARVCDQLTETMHCKIVFVGDAKDRDVSNDIVLSMKQESINTCGETTITQLAELLRRASLAISNDSAVMHMASYLDIPTVAIFGPTDPQKYGPWNSRSLVVRKNIHCSPCQKSGCAFKHECMTHLQPEEVLSAVQSVLKTSKRFVDY